MNIFYIIRINTLNQLDSLVGSFSPVNSWYPPLPAAVMWTNYLNLGRIALAFLFTFSISPNNTSYESKYETFLKILMSFLENYRGRIIYFLSSLGSFEVEGNSIHKSEIMLLIFFYIWETDCLFICLDCLKCWQSKRGIMWNI